MGIPESHPNEGSHRAKVSVKTPRAGIVPRIPFFNEKNPEEIS